MDHKWKPANPLKRFAWGREEICFRCENCGFLQFMNYVLPKDALKAIGVPQCEDYMVYTVMMEAP